MKITVIGNGYVGLITACVFADLGNTVHVVGILEDQIHALNEGKPTIYEPGLEELLKRNLNAKRISFTTSYEHTVSESEIIFIAVGTPPKESGEADLSAVFDVSKKIAQHLGNHFTVIACKSTVPVGTNKKIHHIIDSHKPTTAHVDIASCPEFLREGTALQDTFNPDRVVIGAENMQVIEKLLELHKPVSGKRVIVKPESAEIIKYASNALLATKISFANLISFYCEKTGADVEEVLDGVGLDNRIGRIFLYPGIGYGGSCFPKDVKALAKTGEQLDIDVSLLTSVDAINEQAKSLFVDNITKHVEKGKTIGIWGLSFKPNTDDVREAPSIAIINKLISRGYIIRTYDPVAMQNIKKILGPSITYCENAQDAARQTDALVVLTEWNEFKQIDLREIKKMMKDPVLFDGRNMYDPTSMRKLGFIYYGVGRNI